MLNIIKIVINSFRLFFGRKIIKPTDFFDLIIITNWLDSMLLRDIKLAKRTLFADLLHELYVKLRDVNK